MIHRLYELRFPEFAFDDVALFLGAAFATKLMVNALPYATQLRKE